MSNNIIDYVINIIDELNNKKKIDKKEYQIYLLALHKIVKFTCLTSKFSGIFFLLSLPNA